MAVFRILRSAALVPGMASAAGAARVAGGTDRTLHATSATRRQGLRRPADRAPGATLCLPGARGALFTAFAPEHGVEGCPGPAGPSGQDTLVHSLPVGSCRRASHGP